MSKPHRLSSARREEQRDEHITYVRTAELFHSHGLSLGTRTLYMGGTQGLGEETGCDVLMADQTIKNLHLLEAMSESPITIIMNNPGGDWYHGMAIYDAVKMSPCEITIRVRGHAMSMGSIILQAAHRRLMGSESSQMIHVGTLGYYGHAHTAIKWGDQEKKLLVRMEEIYHERIKEKQPKLSRSKLRRMLSHDTFLTAAESIALGLADAIG